MGVLLAGSDWDIATFRPRNEHAVREI